LRIIEHLDDLILFRYEDFVVDPARHIDGLYRLIGKTVRLKSAMVSSKARMHKDVLSSSEQACIRKHCSVAASRLGYIL
jgi:hypothetical protein